MRAQPFSPFEAAIWKRLAETLMPVERLAVPPAQIVANLQTMFARIEGDKPRETAISLWPLWIVLGGPFWHFAPLKLRRWRVERRLRRSRVDLFQDLARIRGIVYAGYYGHWEGATEQDNAANPVHRAIGFTLPGARDRSRPDDRPIERRPDRDLKPHVFVAPDEIPGDIEVVVIGSGAGGAVAAANLAAQGYRCLIVEAGQHHPSTAISAEEMRMATTLFRDGAIQTTRNRDIIVFQGRTVGGSTVINNGICLRMVDEAALHPDAPDVLAAWAEHDAPVPRAEIDAAYRAIETRLGIAPIEHRLGRANGKHLLDGWSRFAADHPDGWVRRASAHWFAKNWGPVASGHGCVSCGYCNTGCPYGRKHAMPESFLTDATGDGMVRPARILPHVTATRIAWRDGDTPDRIAAGVHVTTADGGARYIPAAKGVVVAAGAIHSSALLQASGIAAAGRNISLNIACPVVALMPDERRAWDEDQMATYVDCGDFLIESHFQPPMAMASLVPGWFEDHFERMLGYNRLASAGILFPADRLGKVVKGRLSFRLGERELATLRRALATLTKVHFAAGALEVYPALLVGETVPRGLSDAEIDRWFEDRVREPDDVVLSSSHPHGGNAIARSPDHGVCDMDNRVFGTANVLVADASVMPSCIRVNAQLTTMAMADRATRGKRPFG